jgi:hypothetical protein
MIAMNTQVSGFRGAQDAQLVKLPTPKRVQQGGKRARFSYGIRVTIFGRQYLFPANKDGTVKKRDRHHAFKAIELS